LVEIVEHLAREGLGHKILDTHSLNCPCVQWV